jgi:hypothetical protein
MDRMVTIPREALAELLRAAGSPLTPEEYLASVTGAVATPDQFPKYRGRRIAAAISKGCLLAAVILSALVCVFSFDLTAFFITVILGVFTYFEYRVHAGFRDLKVEAPMLGFYNQAAFAAFILIYCLYHALVPTQIDIPSEYREYMDPDMTSTIQTAVVVGYLAIAIVGGLSQFGLAYYYRAARVTR